MRQAEALDALLIQLGVKLDAVLSYDMPLEQVIARLSGRRTCAGCKAVFHVTGVPQSPGRVRQLRRSAGLARGRSP